MNLRIDPIGIIILSVWLWMGNQYLNQVDLDKKEQQKQEVTEHKALLSSPPNQLHT